MQQQPGKDPSPTIRKKVLAQKSLTDKTQTSKGSKELTKEFVLNCRNVGETQIPDYNATEDVYLEQFFDRPTVRKLLERTANVKKHRPGNSNKIQHSSAVEEEKLPEIPHKKSSAVSDNYPYNGKTERVPNMPKQLVKIYLADKSAMATIERRKEKSSMNSMSGKKLRQLIERFKVKIKNSQSPIRLKKRAGLHSLLI